MGDDIPGKKNKIKWIKNKCAKASFVISATTTTTPAAPNFLENFEGNQ
jgi:hypothetical protein